MLQSSDREAAAPPTYSRCELHSVMLKHVVQAHRRYLIIVGMLVNGIKLISDVSSEPVFTKFLGISLNQWSACHDV